MSNMITSSKIFYYFLLHSISVGFRFLENGVERYVYFIGQSGEP